MRGFGHRIYVRFCRRKASQNAKYHGYKCRLASMVCNFSDKNFSDGAITRVYKYVVKS